MVAGDFNEDPEKEPIKDVMMSSYLDLYSLSNPRKQHQPFTTFKYRDATGYQKRTIDYIFLL